MSYRCELRPSIDDTDLAAWQSVRGDAADPFTDPRFVRAVERGLKSAGKYWTAIVRDDANRAVASACLCVLPIDLAEHAGGVVKQILQSIRGVYTNALRYPAVFCGLPVSAGQSQLRFVPDANQSAVLQALHQTARELAVQERARFVIFKEFDDTACGELSELERLGYYRADSPPMNHLEPRFENFAAYLAALKAPYRSKIVRSQRKLESTGLRLESITDGHAIAERYTDEVHKLYEAVVDKSPIHLERLTADWFREMARQFDRESVWSAIYQGDRLLAFAYGLLAGGVYYSLFGGVDYSANADTDAYFNLMYYELEIALRSGMHDIHLGQTADDYKSRLGCYQRRLSFYLKPLKWKAALALKIAPSLALPQYPEAPERHVFQKQISSEVKATDETPMKHG